MSTSSESIRNQGPSEIRRCTRCIVPATLPDVDFSSDGVCNLCRDYRPVKVRGEQALKEKLTSKTGETYDCVVPISGGKDSSYILYYAVKVLNLRVVAVNYNSGFQADLARENIHRACEALNVPLVVEKAEYGTQMKMLKDALNISEIFGHFLFTCGNCETNIRTASLKAAHKYGTPFVLYGSSVYEETGRQSTAGIREGFTDTLKRNPLRLPLRLAQYTYHSVRQRMEMGVPLNVRFKPIRHPDLPTEGPIEFVKFFEYVEWDSIRQVDLLTRELGWRAKGEQDARFDCLVHCFQNHRWMKLCGITADGMSFANMVRGGRITREQAMDRELHFQKNIDDECRKALAILGCDQDKIDQLMRTM